MKKLVRLYLWVLSISFAGSLPLGTLNTSVTGLVAGGRPYAALQFGLGAILVEVAIVRIALTATKKLNGNRRSLRWFSVLACAAVLSLAAISLEGAWHMHSQTAIPLSIHSPFTSGLLLSILNPLHLPFWMGWAVVLRAKKLLEPTVASHHVFVVAIGFGTALAFLVYGAAGHILIHFLQVNQRLLNWVVGFTLLLAGLLQLRRVITSSFRAV